MSQILCEVELTNFDKSVSDKPRLGYWKLYLKSPEIESVIKGLSGDSLPEPNGTFNHDGYRLPYPGIVIRGHRLEKFSTAGSIFMDNGSPNLNVLLALGLGEGVTLKSPITRPMTDEAIKKFKTEFQEGIQEFYNGYLKKKSMRLVITAEEMLA